MHTPRPTKNYYLSWILARLLMLLNSCLTKQKIEQRRRVDEREKRYNGNVTEEKEKEKVD